MVEQRTSPLPLKDVQVKGGFWGKLTRMVRECMLPYQWRVLNDQAEDAELSHCIRNFKIAAGLETGDFGGMVFQDSDLAKWLEAVAYSLTTHPDAALEKLADEAIEYVAHAQQPDGYLNTYFTIKAPGKRWTNLRDCHELYCAGHMMEAAVAYYEATGKRKLLDCMMRFARHIMTVIGPEEGKLHGYPGHEEIELALVRMYGVTGEKTLLDLAGYFIDERGREPNFFIEEARKRATTSHFADNTALELSYYQNHLPVRDQKEMEGHSVRGLYLLSGMIDVAVATQDEDLLRSSQILFDNVTKKRMYVTGGVGSTHVGEAFTGDYDLPNDTVYAETCASIALIFAAQRLLQIQPEGRLSDIIEKALYNTCLAGMAQDAKHFFYVNPLEVIPEVNRRNPDLKHVLPVRPAWYGCACCPPNLARLICSIGRYAYTQQQEHLYIHLYLPGHASFAVNGQMVGLSVETEYPHDGRIVIRPEAGRYTLHLHLPGWCHSYTLKRNNEPFGAPVQDGYLVAEAIWEEGDRLELELEMSPRRVYAHPSVASDAGCVAILRGPLVYCAEQVDNSAGLYHIRLPQTSILRTRTESHSSLGRFVRIEADAVTTAAPDENGPLYSETPTHCDCPIILSLLPYNLWANRGEGEMRVWIRERDD